MPVKRIKISHSPEKLIGEVNLPASKSLSNRALIINALSGGKVRINNLSEAEDTRLLDEILKSSGDTFDCKNAGTVLRFLTAYFALKNTRVTLTGSDRMKERPIKSLVEALESLGAEISYPEKEGYPPIRIEKGIRGGDEIFVAAGTSSQFISSLLLIAPFMKGGLTIIMEGDAVSGAYITMTLKLLGSLGITYQQKFNEIKVFPVKLKKQSIEIESDWTSASYWYGLAALFPGSKILLKGLRKNSWQGDSVLMDLMRPFGVNSKKVEEGIEITSTGNYPEKFEAYLVDHPDLVQTFAILSTTLKIPFSITGIQHLIHKETNRIAALEKEIEKLGCNVTTGSDSIKVEEFPEGDFRLENPVQTYGDHRMAMSFALLAVNNPPLVIENPSVVEKSFPSFWKEMEKFGFQTEEI